jgi:hypothetical protein
VLVLALLPASQAQRRGQPQKHSQVEGREPMLAPAYQRAAEPPAWVLSQVMGQQGIALGGGAGPGEGWPGG